MVTVNNITPIPISDLPSASTLTGNEPLPIVQGGQTVQASIASLPAGIEAGVITYGVTGGAPFPNYRTLKAGSGVSIADGGAQGDLTLSANTSPISASYVVMSANSDLTAERVLQVGSALTLTDGGAGGNVTIGSSMLSGAVTSSANSFVTTLSGGIDATKIGGANVDNTEFGYLNGVTSNIQDQINAKGFGTVTKVSVTTVNGISGSVATNTTTPAISLTLDAITPSSVNSIVFSGAATPTLAVSGTSSIAGANTGDQTIILTGDVTGTGTGTFAATVGNNKITYAKMQQASTVTLLGNPTGGASTISEITLGSGLTFAGSTLTASGSGGTVTTTGTPASGNLIKFSGVTSVTNADLSGDVTTNGSTLTVVAKIAGTTVSGTTGSGNVVFSTSPALATPDLGTPSALVGTNITGTAAGFTAGTATVSTTFTVANEGTDTTCFPVFVTAATGNLPAKSNSAFTLNSNTGAFGATSFSGAGTGLTGTAASLTAGTETALATYTLTANTLSANGKLRITTEWSGSGASGGNRRVRFGGSSGTVYGLQSANSASGQGLTHITANNATNAQKASLNTMTAPFGNGTQVTSSVDTTSNVDIVITGQLNNGSDTVRLESYTIEQIEP